MPNKQLIFDHTDGCTFKQDFHSVLKSSDFEDVQGDILVPFPKRTEHFCFFTITDSVEFKKSLAQLLSEGRISSTRKVAEDRAKIAAWKDSGRKDLKPVENMNISFTYTGLQKLGLDVDKSPSPAGSGLDILKKGQLADAADLGDPLDNTTNLPSQWIDEFKNDHNQIHGTLLIACESGETVEKCKENLKDLLGEHIKIVYEFQGDVRADEQTKERHSLKDEHFGWKDRISNPWLKDVFCKCRRIPGQSAIDPEIILLRKCPEWAKNGSYLVFRKLAQLVPEFKNFLKENPVKSFGGRTLSPEEGADLRGAQFVGRWPMGTPLETPDSEVKEKPDVANDAMRNNDFLFKAQDQSKCPFSAHIRKMNPREDEDAMKHNGFGKNFLVRQGIAYGKEVTDKENLTGITELDRGLAFVSYQSNIHEGFRFQQTMWANNAHFPMTAGVETGLDPLIGQLTPTRALAKTFSTKAPNKDSIGLKQFVKPLGGVYCFVPSITTLKQIAGMKK
ncbi:hypothetical protein RHS03_07693, partial [Rhizoctonia solani]